MIKYRNFFISLAVTSAVIAVYTRLPEKTQKEQARPLENEIKTKTSPITSIEMKKVPEEQWKARKVQLRDFSNIDEASLQDLYEETRNWIESDEDDFIASFKEEILEAKELDINASFFLMNAAMKYSSHPDVLANMVLAFDHPDKRLDTHHVGDNNSEKMEMLKVHTLSELSKRPTMTSNLVKTVTKLVKQSSNLATVREGMVLLLKSGEVSPSAMAKLVNHRPKSEHFAFADLL